MSELPASSLLARTSTRRENGGGGGGSGRVCARRWNGGGGERRNSVEGDEMGIGGILEDGDGEVRADLLASHEYEGGGKDT